MNRSLFVVYDLYERDAVEKDFNHIYLFSENLCRTGGEYRIVEVRNKMLEELYKGKSFPRKGQACIRGLPNAYPLTVKPNPRENFSFPLRLDEFNDFKSNIEKDIDRVLIDPRPVKIAASGFATGSTALPKDYAELLQRELREKLGVDTLMVRHTYTVGGYGLVPHPGTHHTI